ncbi:MAG TPA: hypothetical protein VG076_13460 [Acidimicrobiales bacterium]|jgi:hypothetical protein|nr:hypothetical protein [Acidimicrobiales bacterium]
MGAATGAGRVDDTARRFPRQSAAVVVFGTWMIVGLFLDGWSHNHQRPETFFTPWHGVLYSGFLVGVAWFWLEQRSAHAEPGLVGGRLTGVGFTIFAAAAVGDFVWHTLFGIERNIAALLSPTHLLLMTGGLLLVTAPVRDAWARPSRAAGWRELWPVVGSLTLTVALVLFFLQYLSAFRSVVVAQPAGTSFRYFVETAEIRTISSVLVTNAVLMGAVLFTIRRWRPPPGAFTVLFTMTAVAMSGLDSFGRLPLALCAVTGGLVADVLVLGRSPTRVIAGVTPAVLWLSYFVVFKLAYNLPWTIHLWLGTVLLASLSGLGLSLLSAPPAMPDRAELSP